MRLVTARLLLPLIAGLLLGACAQNPSRPSASIQGTGTVHYIDISGGFYGILSDTGRHYDPLNLAPGYQRDGLRVRFEGEEIQGLVTIRMWGRPLRIHHIERLDRFSQAQPGHSAEN